MSDIVSLTMDLSAGTLAAVEAMAADLGISPRQLIGEMLARAVEDEADLLAAVEQGRAQIAAGQGLSHDELVADLQRWKQERRHAA